MRWVLLLVATFGVFIGCSKSEKSKHHISPIVTKTVDVRGGVVEVTDPNSPYYGVKVEIPPQAVFESVEVGIYPGDENLVLPKDTIHYEQIQ